MSAINDYLQLGAGVLILWYGGKLAMDADDGGNGMTAGKVSVRVSRNHLPSCLTF